MENPAGRPFVQGRLLLVYLFFFSIIGTLFVWVQSILS